MTHVINTIKIALESYDKKRVTYIEEYKNITDAKIFMSYNDVKVNTIELYVKDKKIYSGTFEVISIIRNDLRTWWWAWGLLFPKSLCNKVRELHNYGINKLDDNSNELVIQIREFLISNVLHIESDLKKDILFALTSYLSKSNVIIELVLSSETYQKFNQDVAYKTEKIEISTDKYRQGTPQYSIFITI